MRDENSVSVVKEKKVVGANILVNNMLFKYNLSF